MKKYNYHTHTYRCGHAENISDEEYVKEFIDNNFTDIIFTDHMPEKTKIDTRDNMRMDYSQLNEYINSINNLKEKYKNIINIRNGFEVEYLPNDEENILELKSRVDKIVLGQHFIYDDNYNLKHIWGDKYTDEDLYKYATYIIKAIELKIPDLIVHPDIFMLTRDSFGEVEEKITRDICVACEKYNMPLEINLSQIRRFMINKLEKVSYPSKEFWNIVKEYNVNVLYGLDVRSKSQITTYNEQVELVNKYLGDEIINNLHFIEYI